MTPPRPLLAAGALLIALAALASAAPARGDLPTPDSTQCNGKKQGDDCTTDNKKSGACVPSKCGRLDYSGGTPPKSVEWDCLVCSADARKGCSCSIPGGDAAPHRSSAPAGAPAVWALAACLPLLLGLRRRGRGRPRA
jgi:hypothetical protein